MLIRGSGPEGLEVAFQERFERQRSTVRVWVPELPSNVDPARFGGVNNFAYWCQAVGIPYVRVLRKDGEEDERTERWVPLGQRKMDDGWTRTLGVLFFPFATRFTESYRNGRETFAYEVNVKPDLLPFGSEDGFLDFVRQAGSRDELVALYKERGIRYTLGGLRRRVRLDEVPQKAMLDLAIDRNRPDHTAVFTEARMLRGRADTRYAYEISWPATAGDNEIIAEFQALVASGELRAGGPHRAARERVKRWLDEAGLAYKQRNNARNEILLDVYRRSTDCHFELRLLMDASAGTITFWEDYEYLPQPGDGGREYSYGVRTTYSSAVAIADFLGGGGTSTDVEERLAAAFAERVRLGELADEMPLRANRDVVAGWLAAAGVPAEPVDSHWVSMD